MIKLRVFEKSAPAEVQKNAFFDPLVNSRTGICFGLACQPKIEEKQTLRDCSEDDRQYLALRRQEQDFLRTAVEEFLQMPGHQRMKLFIEFDYRLPIAKRNFPALLGAADQMGGAGLFDSLCVMVSDLCFINLPEDLDLISQARGHGISLAVKSASLNSPGLGLLVEASPDFLYLEKGALDGADHDPRKAKTLASLINLSHRLGTSVVAGGVETKRLFYFCREAGCDLIQGGFIAPPLNNPDELKSTYRHIAQLSHNDKRENAGDHRFIESHMAFVEPVQNDTRPIEALEFFKDPEHPVYVPVVNSKNEPLGLVMESILKPFAYSRYGKYILENPTINKSIMEFTIRCPIVDLHSPIDEVLEVYVQDDDLPGVIVVDQMKYMGFLDARALLKALNEKNLAQARDQNPLSKLPGNSVINQYISRMICRQEIGFIIVYFDLDNFKPYNDKYGFRHGDRVLILFSEILKSKQHRSDYFCGHIGGDDFFLGMEDWPLAEAKAEVAAIVDKFSHDVLSFYNSEHREQGGIVALDRFGIERKFPTMTVSAAMLSFPAGRACNPSMNQIGKQIAALKTKAKQGPGKVAFAEAVLCEPKPIARTG